MKVQYLYELQYKRKSELKHTFGGSYAKIIADLGEREVLKLKGGSLALEYVGLIVLEDRVISVLPKILKGKDDRLNKAEVTKLILKVLRKYISENKEVFNTLETTEKNGLNKLSLIDFLFRDYIEYGLYDKTREVFEVNGDGEICWEKTVEEIDPVINGGIPYYVDYITNETESNEEHYIRRLHQYVLTEAKEYLEKFEIGDILEDLFNIPNLDFNILEDGLGDEEYQVKMIEGQLKEEYNERRIKLLHRMKEFIEDTKLYSDNDVELFGVRKFWSVWEKACQEVFGDHYGSSTELKGIMKKKTLSKWEKSGDRGNMIPDIVTENNNDFYILDAKYYSLEGDSFPGVQDVAKQFMYEKAFSERIGEKRTYNAFICPGDKNELFDTVTMELFEGRKIEGRKIEVVRISYQELFKTYTGQGKKMSLDTLKKILHQKEAG